MSRTKGCKSNAATTILWDGHWSTPAVFTPSREILLPEQIYLRILYHHYLLRFAGITSQFFCNRVNARYVGSSNYDGCRVTKLHLLSMYHDVSFSVDSTASEAG